MLFRYQEGITWGPTLKLPRAGTSGGLTSAPLGRQARRYTLSLVGSSVVRGAACWGTGPRNSAHRFAASWPQLSRAVVRIFGKTSLAGTFSSKYSASVAVLYGANCGVSAAPFQRAEAVMWITTPGPPRFSDPSIPKFPRFWGLNRFYVESKQLPSVQDTSGSPNFSLSRTRRILFPVCGLFPAALQARGARFDFPQRWAIGRVTCDWGYVELRFQQLA